MKIKDTCYNNNKLDYAAITVEIVDPFLVDKFGGRFQLQVWDLVTKKLAF